jgi:hypothetical protein
MTAQFPDRFHPVEVRHQHVGDDQVAGLPAVAGQAGFATVRFFDLVSGGDKHAVYGRAEGIVIVDEHNSRHATSLALKGGVEE